MALTIFLCGHGSWNPKDDFIQLPPGCSLTFIVHHAKLLPTDDMYRVCGGTYTGEPDRTVGAPGSVVRTCPNMTWTRDEPGKITICDQRLKANAAAQPAIVMFPNHMPGQLDNSGSLTLKKFFDDYWAPIGQQMLTQYGQVEFIWNCCSHVALKPSAMGAELGVNAGQFDNRFEHLSLVGGGITPIGKVTRF